MLSAHKANAYDRSRKALPGSPPPELPTRANIGHPLGMVKITSVTLLVKTSPLPFSRQLFLDVEAAGIILNEEQREASSQ